MLSVIMSYGNRPPAKFGMGETQEVLSQTYTLEENLAGLFTVSSYGLLTLQPPPVGRVEKLDMGNTSYTTVVPNFCADLIAGETTRALSLLSDAGIDTSTSAFDIIEFILPSDSGCWFAGMAEQQGQRMWIDSPSLQTRTHEVGHTIGM
eukprot:2723981-Prymnesium_polylepis.1